MILKRLILVVIFICLLIGVNLNAQTVIQTELAGKPLQNYPYFQYERSINENSSVSVAIDPSQFPAVVNQEFDIFITLSKSKDEWQTSPALIDVRPGGAQTVNGQGTTIQDNTFLVADTNTLPGQSGYGLGIGYDVVLDMDQDGTLSDGDVIDGFSNEEAGFYIVHNTIQAGPLDVTMIEYSGGGWLTQRLFYSSNITSMGELPLVVISHGWMLEYTEYDFIGNHLASYGYIVMVHTNDVGNGGSNATMTAAVSIIDNIDYIIGEQGAIGGGILNGHIDLNKIVMIGHSTGGEAVVRAYTGIKTGSYTPQHFNFNNIILISCLPPVSFWQAEYVNPFDVNYHMFIGSSDGDCSGAPVDEYVQSMAIFERSTGNRQLTYLHGAGHWDFSASTFAGWPQGPDQIGRETTNNVVKGYYLPLVEFYTKSNPAGKDFFTRMYDDFHPIGIPDNVIIANEYRQQQSTDKVVIDDFETNTGTTLSSSGGTVSYDVSNINEVLMQDIDNFFQWTGLQPSNGMTRDRFNDTPHCVVFDWTVNESKYYEQEIIQEYRDFTEYQYLSFRACQGTRHPETVALDDKLSFTVTLRDESGNSSSINFDNYGKLTKPYQRTGYGSGAGWGNEFATVQIRLRDFLMNNSGLDLEHVEAIRFEFGSAFGSGRGRIGLDDIELVEVDSSGIITGLHGENDLPKTPAKFGLHTNYPNPFNPSTTIRYDLQRNIKVSLKIYNILWQEVRTLVNEVKTSGTYSVQWNGTNDYGQKVPGGIYFYKISSGSHSEIKKMFLIR